MIFVGIICALVTAFSQSCAYLCSRLAVVGKHASPIQLLVIGHVFMGLVSAMIIGFILPQDMPPMRDYAWNVIAASLPYYVGQIGLFSALKYTDASRVSPLLGLKVVFVAIIAVVALDQSLAPLQWMAVVLASCAAMALNAAGGRLPKKIVAAVLLTCVLYALSDVHITKFIEQMKDIPSIGPIHAAIVAGLVCYVFCGALSLLLLPIYGSRQVMTWRASIPYATFWIAAIMFMFVAYALAGVVLGVIVISTRGLMSIVLGIIVARFGMHHLERKVEKGVLLRRILAAAMMLTAVALFVYSEQSQS